MRCGRLVVLSTRGMSAAVSLAQTLSRSLVTLSHPRQCLARELPRGPDVSSSPTHDSDWACSCGFRNFSFRTVCFHCQQPNPQTPSRQRHTPAGPLPFRDDAVPGNAPLSSHTSPPPPSPQPYKRGDWTCQCGTHNFARRTVCLTCMQPRSEATVMEYHRSPGGELDPSDVGDPMRGRSFEQATDVGGAAGAHSRHALRPGDWVCPSCTAHNFRSRDCCFGCGQEKPSMLTSSARQGRAGLADDSSARGHWVCPACHTPNQAKARQCAVCGSAGPSRVLSGPVSSSARHSHQGADERSFRSAEEASGRPGDWSCPACGFYNFASREKCRMCKSNKPAAGSHLGDGNTTAHVGATGGTEELHGGGRDGKHWICECGYRNYAERPSCRDCGERRPPAAPEVADPPSSS